MKIKGYNLAYEPKISRVYEKDQAGKDATEEQVLAFYDKFGGLILKDGIKVENGKFWADYTQKLASEHKAEVEKVKKEELKAKDVEIAKSVEKVVKVKVKKVK